MHKQEENIAPTRVRKRKTPKQVNFNLHRNIIHNINSSTPNIIQPIHQATATAAHVSAEERISLPRVKNGNKKEIKTTLSNNVRDKFDTAITYLKNKYSGPSFEPTPKPSNIHNKSYKHRAAMLLTATEIFCVAANHIYDENGKKETVDSLINGKDRKVWNQALSNEIGRLVQGNDNGVKSTDCMEFIFKHEVPERKKVTYANFVCDHRPLKTEPFRIRLVVGGDKLEYADDTGSPAASMLETKLLVNSVISDADDGA